MFLAVHLFPSAHRSPARAPWPPEARREGNEYPDQASPRGGRHVLPCQIRDFPGVAQSPDQRRNSQLELTVNVLILVRYSRPPGISTTSRRAPCPFCRGQCQAGRQACRVPSAPRVCPSFPIPAATACPQHRPLPCPLHGLHLPSSFHAHAPFPLLKHQLPLSHCMWHLQSFFPVPFPSTHPTSLPSIPAVPPSPQGKGGAGGPRAGSFCAGCSGRSWLYLQEKEKAPCAEPNRELNMVSCGVGSSWLG